MTRCWMRFATGRGVIGTSSAELRRLHVGDRFVFAKGRITGRARSCPDEVVAWREVMVSRDVGRPLGVRHDRFALLRMQGEPTEAQLARRIAPSLGPGYRPRVRRPGQATFRRQGDSVWPPVLDETRVRGVPGLPGSHGARGYLRMHPSFVNQHLVSRTVPLLGRFTCNERVFPPLIAAMKELRNRGAGRGDPQLRGLLQRAHGDAASPRTRPPTTHGPRRSTSTRSRTRTERRRTSRRSWSTR